MLRSHPAYIIENYIRNAFTGSNPYTKPEYTVKHRSAQTGSDNRTDNQKKADILPRKYFENIPYTDRKTASRNIERFTAGETSFLPDFKDFCSGYVETASSADSDALLKKT